jgi:hypothetical protein
MRSFIVRAARAVALFGGHDAVVAAKVSDQDLLKMERRFERWRFSGQWVSGGSMPPHELLRKSRQWRRARQGKPGKRGRS